MKSRGDPTSQDPIADGDYIGNFGFSGYDGTLYRTRASIQGIVNGTVAAATIPIDMIFSTGESGAVERMRIAEDGNIGIDVTDPETKLDINGTMKLTKYGAAPYACDAAHDGAIGLNTANYLCVCINGTGWRRASDGSTACTGW